MHIARQIMQIAGQDGALRQVMPGEALPDFMSWPYTVREAHLLLGNVEEPGADYVANWHLVDGRLSLNGNAPDAVPKDMQPSDVTPEAVLVETVIEAEDLPEAAKAFACPDCESVYASRSSLTRHRKAHT